MPVSAEFKDEERSGWFIGLGRAMMTRASLFRETRGVAVEMVNRVYDSSAIFWYYFTASKYLGIKHGFPLMD